MKKLAYKLRPTAGFSSVLHILFNALLPIAILFFVRLGFEWIAVAVVLLAKWRTVAVRPRYWIPNVRSNLVDIFVGLSVVAFMSGTTTFATQIFWTIAYIVWLVWLKPKSNPVAVMTQALIAQAVTLVAFYRAFPESSLLVGILAVWLICYASARHFLGAFDEPMTRSMVHIWAWFGACMAWVLGHWVIQYLFLPQIALILTILGYGLATLYYLDKKEKLKAIIKRQLIGVMGLLLLIIIVFSDWQDKTV
jgi:hypothetical protein